MKSFCHSTFSHGSSHLQVQSLCNLVSLFNQSATLLRCFYLENISLNNWNHSCSLMSTYTHLISLHYSTMCVHYVCHENTTIWCKTLCKDIHIQIKLTTSHGFICRAHTCWMMWWFVDEQTIYVIEYTTARFQIVYNTQYHKQCSRFDNLEFPKRNT